MSLMTETGVLRETQVGSIMALWTRIDAGAFPRPVAMSAGVRYWDQGEVLRAIEIIRAPGPDEPLKRDQPTPEQSPEQTDTREQKDPPRRTPRASK